MSFQLWDRSTLTKNRPCKLLSNDRLSFARATPFQRHRSAALSPRVQFQVTVNSFLVCSRNRLKNCILAKVFSYFLYLLMSLDLWTSSVCFSLLLLVQSKYASCCSASKFTAFLPSGIPQLCIESAVSSLKFQYVRWICEIFHLVNRSNLLSQAKAEIVVFIWSI